MVDSSECVVEFLWFWIWHSSILSDSNRVDCLRPAHVGAFARYTPISPVTLIGQLRAGDNPRYYERQKAPHTRSMCLRFRRRCILYHDEWHGQLCHVVLHANYGDESGTGGHNGSFLRVTIVGPIGRIAFWRLSRRSFTFQHKLWRLLRR